MSVLISLKLQIIIVLFVTTRSNILHADTLSYLVSEKMTFSSLLSNPYYSFTFQRNYENQSTTTFMEFLMRECHRNYTSVLLTVPLYLPFNYYPREIGVGEWATEDNKVRIGYPGIPIYIYQLDTNQETWNFSSWPYLRLSRFLIHIHYTQKRESYILLVCPSGGALGDWVSNYPQRGLFNEFKFIQRKRLFQHGKLFQFQVFTNYAFEIQICCLACVPCKSFLKVDRLTGPKFPRLEHLEEEWNVQSRRNIQVTPLFVGEAYHRALECRKTRRFLLLPHFCTSYHDIDSVYILELAKLNTSSDKNRVHPLYLDIPPISWAVLPLYKISRDLNSFSTYMEKSHWVYIYCEPLDASIIKNLDILNMLLPFDSCIWVGILGSILTIGVILNFGRNRQSAFFGTYGVLMRQGISNFTVISLWFSLGVIVISCLYEGVITSITIAPFPDAVLDNLSEVVDSGRKLIIKPHDAAPLVNGINYTNQELLEAGIIQSRWLDSEIEGDRGKRPLINSIIFDNQPTLFMYNSSTSDIPKSSTISTKDLPGMLYSIYRRYDDIKCMATAHPPKFNFIDMLYLFWYPNMNLLQILSDLTESGILKNVKKSYDELLRVIRANVICAQIMREGKINPLLEPARPRPVKLRSKILLPFVLCIILLGISCGCDIICFSFQLCNSASLFQIFSNVIRRIRKQT